MVSFIHFKTRLPIFNHGDFCSLKTQKASAGGLPFNLKSAAKSTSAASSAPATASTSVSGTSFVTPAFDPYSKRTVIKGLLSANDGRDFIGQTIRVGGWVKSGREQKDHTFLGLNDGSTPKNLQVCLACVCWGVNLQY
jgi:hypothetical protein